MKASSSPVRHPSVPVLPLGRRGASPALLISAAVFLGSMVIALRSAESPRDAGPAAGALPIGSIVAFGGPATAVPEAQGWMLCDGRELPASAFRELNAVLGGAWGHAPAGATFRLPDLRGRFARGVNYGAAPEFGDPDKADRLPSAEGGNAGNEVGSQQGDAAGPHTHPLAGVGNALGIGTEAGFVRLFGTKLPDDAAPILKSEGSVQPNAGTETRPRNVYVNWIIRVR